MREILPIDTFLSSFIYVRPAGIIEAQIAGILANLSFLLWQALAIAA